MAARHCLGCGRLITRGSRCRACPGPRRVRNSYAWQKLRAQAVAAHPWCVDCGTRVDLTVDHVVPLSEGGAALDSGNVATRCRSCNSAKGAR